MSKTDKINQRINNGNENIQIGGDVNAENLSINLFKDPFVPKAIIFYEEHLVEVIEVFDKEYGKKMDVHSDEYEKKIEELKKFKDTKKDKKNKKNRLSEIYFRTICDRYLHYFDKIDIFLMSPMNIEFNKKYQSSAIAINMQIMVLRHEFDKFEEILLHILQGIIENGKDTFKDNIDIFIVFINYMYWNCDIGER